MSIRSSDGNKWSCFCIIYHILSSLKGCLKTEFAFEFFFYWSTSQNEEKVITNNYVCFPNTRICTFLLIGLKNFKTIIPQNFKVFFFQGQAHSRLYILSLPKSLGICSYLQKGLLFFSKLTVALVQKQLNSFPTWPPS